MIVKNETRVIKRCLDSVRPFIHHWVIVDTGSTDGTQELVKKLLAGVPGELHERPWRNFGYNRTEALELARGKADYILIMDADEVFEVPPGFRMPALEDEQCLILHR
ncbi:MAG TPA: glycosyltransferase, partial [Polyangiaceae bacterium]